jgi:Carbohydrate family 9 binding domain-like
MKGRKMKKSIILTLIGFCLIGKAIAESPVKYDCFKTDEKIVIDGKLDEKIWEKADVIELNDSKDGSAPVQKTKVKMCWDDYTLYLAFICSDKDIWSSFKNHDDYIYEENAIEAFINVDKIKNTYAEIQISPLNVKFDTFVLNKIGCSWNKVVTAYNPKSFVSAVVVDGTVNNHDDIDKSWTVELAISMKDLGCEKKVKVNDSWTIGLFRLMKNKKTGKVNASSWARLGKKKFHTPESFGEIIFKGVK